MRIGIDARCLEWQRGGVARFLGKILTIWSNEKLDHEIILYFQSGIPADEFIGRGGFICRVIPGPRYLKRRRIVAEQILLPFSLGRDKLDLFFATWYSAPLFPPKLKTVVAAWDISYSTHPEHYSFANQLSLGVFSKIACRRAAGVVTCSPYDRDQIRRVYGIPSNRICTLRLGVGDEFERIWDDVAMSKVRKKLGIPRKYILSLGVIHNRRNVDVIINAFKEIASEFSDVALVVVGRNATRPAVDIDSLISELRSRGRSIYVPWIDEADLVYLYSGAMYYICTSTVDGESIMLKEAMKCGTPVITSPLLAPAVEWNALVIEDPTSHKNTVEVLRRALSSVEERESLSERGLAWVSGLSWEDVAGETLRFLVRCGSDSEWKSIEH